MFKSKFFISFKTLHVFHVTVRKPKNLLNKEKLSNQYDNSRCTCSDVEYSMYQFSGKIHAPISQNMRGQQHVHRRGTDRQTGWNQYTLQTSFSGGIMSFHWYLLYVQIKITFSVAQSVDGQASNPWVAGSNLAPVLKSRLIHVVLCQSHRFWKF